VDHLVDPGFAEWLVAGSELGTATLAVTGDSNCGDPAACPPRTVRLAFRVP
jgi:hypothetical protein